LIVLGQFQDEVGEHVHFRREIGNDGCKELIGKLGAHQCKHQHGSSRSSKSQVETTCVPPEKGIIQQSAEDLSRLLSGRPSRSPEIMRRSVSPSYSSVTSTSTNWINHSSLSRLRT